MINKMLTKVLWQKKGRWELILGSLGFLIGLAMLLLCLQLYVDIDDIFNRRLSLEKQLDYIILSKKIDPETIIDKDSMGFSEDDIANLKSQDFTEDIGIIRANEFVVNATISAFGKGFITELFFESVPDRFLDHIPEDWGWDETSKRVPIMISRDFLLLYNFGFSQARDFPFLSEDMLKLVSISLDIQGRKNSLEVDARIAGLSDRISSFLVPDSFMQWANKNFQNNKQTLPTRIIISVKNRSNPGIISYINNHNYEVSREKLRLSDAGFTITIILGIITFIGILLVALSFVIFMVTFRLVLSQSTEEITLLIDLGYTKKMIINNLMRLIIPLFIIIYIIVITIVTVTISLFHNFLGSKGFIPPDILFPLILTTGFILIAAGVAGNYFSMRMGVSHE